MKPRTAASSQSTFLATSRMSASVLRSVSRPQQRSRNSKTPPELGRTSSPSPDDEGAGRHPQIRPFLSVFTEFRFAPKKPISVTGYETGEDAFFGSCNFPRFYIGIADGVGGYAKRGVNPAEISNNLMSLCGAVCSINEVLELHDPQGTVLGLFPCLNWQAYVSRPAVLLEHAFDALVGMQKVKAGGTTAVMMGFDGSTGVLHVANLGDSGFVVLRRQQAKMTLPRILRSVWSFIRSPFSKSKKGQDDPSLPYEIVAKSTPQQHRFNCPFQLSLRDYKAGRTRPNRADLYEVNLLRGDIVIAGTDGLFDNVYPREICNLVNKQFVLPSDQFVVNVELEKKGVDLRPRLMYVEALERFSDELLEVCVGHAHDPEIVVPFWIEHAKYHGEKGARKGGKIDDITFSVSVVAEVGISEDEEAAEANDDDVVRDCREVVQFGLPRPMEVLEHLGKDLGELSQFWSSE